ncbi:cobalamin-dependent protein [bacterium]|nr:cobalamin-dependent protein [candidate division CSSED10-310 bacterium]
MSASVTTGPDEGAQRDARRVLLVFPPSLYLNYTPPLNLAYLAAVLEKAGHFIGIIDASALHGVRTIPTILAEAAAWAPDFIGMTLNVMFIQPAYELARELKKRFPEVMLAAGGPHPSLLGGEALEQGFDVAVCGEGEETIVELMDVLNGRRQLRDVAGIIYNDGGDYVETTRRRLIDNLDALPFPAKHLFNAQEYIASTDSYQAFGPIFSGRGCPAQCTYCYKGVFGAQVRVRSAENVFAEMMFLHDRHGVTAFEFMDDTFSIFPDRVERLCDLILESGLTFRWQCTTRLDFTTSDLLIKMKEAGCFRVFYGFETGDPDTLLRIRKRLDIEQAIKVLKWSHEAGIRSIVGFMFGFPWETAAQVNNTTRIIRRLRSFVDEFNPLGIMIPVPGTEIYREFSEQFGLRNWWLEDNFGRRYRTNTYYPYFRKRFYNDFSLLEDGFFPFPPDVRRAIIRGTRVIGTHNIFHNILFPKNIIVYALVHFSMLLYRISPRLEQHIFLMFDRMKGAFRKVCGVLR